jgi:hypothetical protein
VLPASICAQSSFLAELGDMQSTILVINLELHDFSRQRHGDLIFLFMREGYHTFLLDSLY